MRFDVKTPLPDFRIREIDDAEYRRAMTELNPILADLKWIEGPRAKP